MEHRLLELRTDCQTGFVSLQKGSPFRHAVGLANLDSGRMVYHLSTRLPHG